MPHPQRQKERRLPYHLIMAKINKDPGNPKKNPKNILKKVLALFGGFVISYALLRGIVAVSEHFHAPLVYYIGTLIYATAVGALFAAFYVLNGYTFDNRDREIDELPARWSDEKKAEFLEKQPARRARAKKLLFVLLPAVVSILVSIIELNFFG